jgi:hypothetical protein
MKQVFTLSFLFVSLSVFSQQKIETSKPAPAKAEQAATQVPAVNPRSQATSTQGLSQAAAPLPYDMNDKYMGRKEEFLGNMTVTQIPADFPLYDKNLSLEQYNKMVDTYYMNHKELLKDRVKEKIIYIEQH